MKSFKKSLFVLLVLMLIVTLLLSACGGNNNTANQTEPSNTPDASNEVKPKTPDNEQPKDKTEISGEITVAAWEFVEKAITPLLPEFNKEYPNVKVNFKVAPPADHYKKLLIDLSSGQGAADVVGIEIQNLAQYMELGALVDLTALTNPYKDQFNSYKIDSATLDGNVYAMPMDSGPVGIYYRRDVFEKAGLPSDPESVAKQLATWEQYVETAKIIKEKAGVPMLPLAGSTNDARFFQIIMQQQGNWYFDAEGKTVINNDKTKQVLQLFKELWDGGYTAEAQEWTDGWYALLKDGQVATLPMAVWMGGFLKSWVAPDTGGKWGVVPLPVWEEGGNKTSNDGGSYLAITNQTKNEEAAKAFVEFVLAKKESQMTMFKQLDSFPALETTYDDPYFAEEDAYFGGQAYRQLFADLADEIIPVNYTGSYSEANALTQTEIQKLATNKQDIDETVEAIEKAIKSKTGR
jgi:lactose/L-arabinose transport system substrate-binding protein